MSTYRKQYTRQWDIAHWLERHFGGHVSFRIFGIYVVLYGFNAMHIAVNIHMRRWGWICFHPGIRFYRQRWPWKFYVSPNGTPWAATIAIGPGIGKTDKRRAKERRRLWGIKYDCNALTYAQIQLEESLT